MKKIFLLFIISCILNACGFYLKGTSALSRTLPFKEWDISNTRVLEKYLKQELIKNKDVNFNSSPKAARIKIIKFDTEKQIQTINRIGLVDDYLLYSDISVQIVYNNKDYGDPINLRVNRNITLNNNNIFGKQEEETSIWEEIYQETAEQIVNRLKYINVNN